MIGAGPAGLLTAIKLLQRNLTGTNYHVTLVDPGVDYGRLNPNELQRKRSWMIGLSSHGANAIKSVPDLYENYVKGLGINVEFARFQPLKEGVRRVTLWWMISYRCHDDLTHPTKIVVRNEDLLLRFVVPLRKSTAREYG